MSIFYMRERNVILTGAGAVVPWGAPKTDEITSILRNDSTFVNDKGEPIGEYLYSLLKTQMGKRRAYNTPNFESILHFIELLFEYKKSRYSMSSSFFRINDFFLIDPEIQNKLEIYESQKLDKRLDTSFGTKRPIANEYYYYELYLHFIFLIKKEIEKYETVEENKYHELNKSFNRFLNQVKGENGIVRFYTLNYDYLVPNISNLKFFDGYDEKTGKINVKKIIEDDNIDCYYHLHGSFKLNYIGEKSNDYSSCSLQRNFVQNNLIPSNIITGYHKPERILDKTFYEFYQKMVEDLIKANKIYIIGYSFNDMHVNAALIRALKKGTTKVTVVDKCCLPDFHMKYDKIVDSNPDYDMNKLIEFPNTYQMTTEAPKAKAYLNGLIDFLDNLIRSNN